MIIAKTLVDIPADKLAPAAAALRTASKRETVERALDLVIQQASSRRSSSLSGLVWCHRTSRRQSWRHDAVGEAVLDTTLRTPASAAARRSSRRCWLLIAATALVHECEILHYDSDYDLLAAAEPGLRTRWIVPQGSVPSTVSAC